MGAEAQRADACDGAGMAFVSARRELAAIIRTRHSARDPFDPAQPPSEADLGAILEAARWAPTAHNMQNYEVVIVDDPDVLARIGRVPTTTSPAFLRENHDQLSFSETELIRKGTGLLATLFPPAWRDPDGEHNQFERGFLEGTMRSCPVVLIVIYDSRTRAPASEGDMLGIMSLGCVMQNMWLTAESRGIGMQIMSVFSSTPVQEALQVILSLPPHMHIAFACRLGHPVAPPGRYLRVRRSVRRFRHRNSYVAHESSVPAARAG